MEEKEIIMKNLTAGASGVKIKVSLNKPFFFLSFLQKPTCRKFTAAIPIRKVLPQQIPLIQSRKSNSEEFYYLAANQIKTHNYFTSFRPLSFFNLLLLLYQKFLFLQVIERGTGKEMWMNLKYEH